jgi:hypothetical protein
VTVSSGNRAGAQGVQPDCSVHLQQEWEIVMASLDRTTTQRANVGTGRSDIDRLDERRETRDVPSALDRIDPPIVEEDRMQPQPPEGRGDSPTITADTARQGPEGSRVVWVVAIGAIGAFVLMAIVYMFFASSGG